MSSDCSVVEALEGLHKHLWGQDRINVVSVAGKSRSTLDLRLFSLRENTCPFDVLLIRDEYQLAYEAIHEKTLRTTVGRRKSTFLVTGQTGIGKTLFLLYILARRLQQEEPVAFQINSEQFALFNESGVSLHSAETGRAPIGVWALSDSGNGRLGPCTAFEYRHRAHVIYTSSPASRRWKGRVKPPTAFMYIMIMDVWSLGELQTLLTLYGLDVERGAALLRKFGPSPRIIVDILIDPNMEDQYLRQITTIEFVPDFSAILLNVENLDFSELSSGIFTLRPDTLHSQSPTFCIPTPFLASTLGIAVSRQTAAQQRSFFAMLSGWTTGRTHFRSAAEWLFGSYAHISFCFPNSSLNGYLNDDLHPHLIPNPDTVIAGSAALKQIRPPFSFYWQPREPIFKGVDALIRLGDIVWALQFTMSASHDSATEGLENVFKIMNYRAGVEWRLVVVGPDRRTAEFARGRQNLTGQWANICVYACELPFGTFTEEDVQRLRTILNEANGTYPMDQRAGLGM